MEPKEFEELLNDVETRLDRLRALYENWFRGYEKLEPQTARKDVERRIYTMRKELPRNTGLRFRYNTLFQRYTTLTSYWQRTGKQIEEGTYRPQLQRLRRKHERQREMEQEREKQPRERRDDEPPRPQSYELSLDENLNVKDLLDDFELDAVARAVEEPGPYSEPPPPTITRPMATFAKPSDNYRGGSAPKPVPRASHDAIPLSDAPSHQHDEEITVPPVAAKPAPATPSLKKPPAVPPPPPGRVAPPGVVPPPPPSAITASGVRVSPPLPSQAQRSVPRPPGPTPSATSGPSVPRPPAVVGTPSAARAPSQAQPTPGLGEQRLKSLYDEYSSARRKNNEGDVRYDALVNSIQKMLPELQKKHAGKQIDFEIVLKDGRVGLKPKAR